MKKIKNKKISVGDNFLSRLSHILYAHIGKKLARDKRFNFLYKQRSYDVRYKDVLQKANMRVLPEEFFFTIHFILIVFIALIIILDIVLFIFSSVFAVALLYVGILLTCLLGIFLFNYPFFVAKRRGKEIDAVIPFVVPYLKLLSRELNFSKILEIIPDFLIYKEIKMEFERINYHNKILGQDVHASVRSAMNSSPSKELSDLLNDLVSISNSGGDAYTYLEGKVESAHIEVDSMEKKNVETLLIFSQIYTILLLIAPLFFVLMIAILSSISSSVDIGISSGGDGGIANVVKILVALPLAYILFITIIYFSKPLYTRIK